MSRPASLMILVMFQRIFQQETAPIAHAQATLAATATTIHANAVAGFVTSP